MIYKNHKVSITVNNNFLELSDQSSLNLRLNNTIYDPTKLSSSQAEYSFTFNVPLTAKNNNIFDFANILSKKNKFNKLYETIVYADGNEIFRGQLKISEITTDEYKCNLVSVKVNKIEDIFGESKMNEINWYVPYKGMETIKSVNSDLKTDYFFPLVSYGVFQKKPRVTYKNEYNAYSSKYLLDKYVQWYDESFSPSVKLNELIKKMFEQKGYNVTGNIFEDDIANEIYLSTHLADKQIPNYNLAETSQGKIECTFDMWTGKQNERQYRNGRVTGTSSNLEYKYDYVRSECYNFEQIETWNIFKVAASHKEGYGDISGMTFTQNNDNLFRDGYIQIPADGAYKIELEVDIDISSNKAREGALFYNTRGEQEVGTVSHSWEAMPVEVQLVRNSDLSDIELIHGFDNKVYSVYPHEAPNTAQTSTTGVRGGSQRTFGDTNGGRRGRSRGIIETEPDAPDPEDFNMGFMPRQGFMLCYDQKANPNFVCGVSTIGNCPSVIKNGYSWSSDTDTEMHSRYNCGGYYGVNWNSETSAYDWKSTTFNANNYPGSPLDLVADNGAFKKKCNVSCVVWLNRNDLLSLVLVQRKYEAGTYHDDRFDRDRSYYVVYNSKVNGKIKIEAYSPNVGDLTSNDLNYKGASKFDKDLNLGQFMNKDVKQADFVNNFIKAFNLTTTQVGNSVILNKNYIDYNRMIIPVNLDNRVYNKNVNILPIEYPSSMQIKYSIDEEEAGFYNSVPYPEINYDNWKDYADVGSEKITLSMSEDTSNLEQSLSNSYTWYSPFKVRQYDADGTLNNELTISLPIIIKDEWMIENYKYEESMQVDGKSLKQRWWFRQNPNTSITFETTDGISFNPSIPTNSKDGFTLNYKNDDGTLLTRFFNITTYTSSDMIEFECYLTPDEYILLKKGAPIKINSDIYYTCSITGYDPTGNNEAKIKAMKKG